MTTGIIFDGDIIPPRFTVAELVERAYALDPESHGKPVEAAIAEWSKSLPDPVPDEEAAAIVAAGLDPEEMLPGNKPRYVVTRPGVIRDCATGEERPVEPAKADEC